MAYLTSQKMRLKKRHKCALCCVKPHVPGLTHCEKCQKKVNKEVTARRNRNRRKFNAYMRAYYHRTKNLKVSSARTRRRYQQLRKEAIRVHGSKCRTCGFSNPLALQIDHIKGGGMKDRSRTGDVGFLKGVIRDALKPIRKRKYQLLCANHNVLKMHSKREHSRYH